MPAAGAAPAGALLRWPIAALSFAAFASAASMRVTDALLPRLDAEFGIGLGVAAQVVTAFAIAYGLLQAAYGIAGDRFGKYRLVAWACMASAVTALGCAFAPQFGALVAARFVAGGTAAERFSTTPIVVAGAFATLVIGWVFSRLLATHRDH